MIKYRIPDEKTLTVSYGQLREWAEECESVKDWMKSHLPNAVFEEMPDETYRVGQRFIISSSRDEYILAALGNSQVALISLTNGRKWRDPVRVNNYERITKAEMLKIARTTFS